MKSSGRILNVDIISSLKVGHHTFRESHIKVGFYRIMDISLVKVGVSEDELDLEFVNKLINLLIASAFAWRALFTAFLDLNFDLSVFLIQLISSDHVCFVLRTSERFNLNPFYELIRNIRLVVVALFASSHFYLPDFHCFLVFIV